MTIFASCDHFEWRELPRLDRYGETNATTSDFELTASEGHSVSVQLRFNMTSFTKRSILS